MVSKAGFCVLCTLFLLLTCRVWAAQSLDEMAVETLQTGQKVQKLVKEWNEKEKKLQDEISALQEETQRLEVQLVKLDQAERMEEERIVQQQRRLRESLRLREGLLVWLQSVSERMEKVAALRLPFLSRERERRLEDLNGVLADPYTSLDEQFRRVFEVLLVEAEFGHSSEVYRDSISVDGEEFQVDLLRVGRLALFFRTLDGKRAGMFDPETKQFCWLESAALNGISRAFAVVRRETAPEMVTLPVGRIVHP